jgi:hypothetical protein
MPAPFPVTEKLCPDCNKIKRRDEFYSSKPTGRRRTGRISHRCKPCANIYSAKLIAKNKRAWKEFAGGECIVCGYKKCWAALDFHHRDPKKKTMEIALKTSAVGPNTGTEKSLAIHEEILKCDLVCANCHREIHNEPDNMSG